MNVITEEQEMFEEFEGQAVEVAEDIFVVEVTEEQLIEKAQDMLQDGFGEDAAYRYGVRISHVTRLDCDIDIVGDSKAGTYYSYNGGENFGYVT